MKKKKIFFIIILFFFKNQILYGIENKILFKVNDELITSIDIFNMSKYLKALDPDIGNLNDNKIFDLTKNLIIKEKIKKFKIQEEGILFNVTDEQLDSYINSIFLSERISNLRDYKNFVESLGLNFDYMKEKLTIELIWNGLIFKKFSSKIKINKDEIKEKILIKKNKNISSYLLSEIVFEVSNKSEINTNYNRIMLDIKNLGFKKAALIHSIARSADNGGDIGWVDENALNNKVLKIINKLQINEVSKPITLPDGFFIIKLREKKSIEKKLNFDFDKEYNKLIQIKTNQQLNQYSNLYFNKVKKEIEINAF